MNASPPAAAGSASRPSPSSGIPLALRRTAIGLAGLAVAVIAGAACVLSFDDLRALAIAGQAEPRLAYLYPAGFDALLIVALITVPLLREARLAVRVQVGLILILLLITAATGAVVSTAGVTFDVRQAAVVVALLPWVMLVIALWLLLVLIKHAQVRRADLDAVNDAGEIVPFDLDATADTIVHARSQEKSESKDVTKDIGRGTGQPEVPALAASPASSKPADAEKSHTDDRLEVPTDPYPAIDYDPEPRPVSSREPRHSRGTAPASSPEADRALPTPSSPDEVARPEPESQTEAETQPQRAVASAADTPPVDGPSSDSETASEHVAKHARGEVTRPRRAIKWGDLVRPYAGDVLVHPRPGHATPTTTPDSSASATTPADTAPAAAPDDVVVAEVTAEDTHQEDTDQEDTDQAAVVVAAADDDDDTAQSNDVAHPAEATQAEATQAEATVQATEAEPDTRTDSDGGTGTEDHTDIPGTDVQKRAGTSKTGPQAQVSEPMADAHVHADMSKIDAQAHADESMADNQVDAGTSKTDAHVYADESETGDQEDWAETEPQILLDESAIDTRPLRQIREAPDPAEACDAADEEDQGEAGQPEQAADARTEVTETGVAETEDPAVSLAPPSGRMRSTPRPPS